ncbi:MAG: ATP-binding protein [Fimbriimonadales bacterium]
MPEFDRNVLEGLRQPLEDGIVSVARVQATLDFPAEMMLIGALNPCPCGFHGDRVKACSCSPDAIRRYLGRISGPLLDRIDLHVEVPRLTQDELVEAKAGEPSEAIAGRVQRARQMQTDRFAGAGTKVNARMTTRELKEFCPLSDGCKDFLRSAAGKLGLSARVYDRAVKVARTIADLAGDKDIAETHLSEAVQYRLLDRGMA